MSVKSDIDIILPENGIVYSGSEVTGTVTLTVDKPITVKGVTVELIGKGQCKWSERKSESVVIWYFGNEKYVNDVKELIKPEGDEEKITLVPGVQKFPFSFQVPEGAPSSRELPDASIRYRIQVKVIRSWMKDLKFNVYFTVFTNLDLNIEAFASDPILAEEKKNFYSLMINRGDMKVEIRSPVGGYVPGQIMPLACKIINGSHVGVKHVEAALFKKIKYTEDRGHYTKLRPQRKEKVICHKLATGKDGVTNVDLELTIPSDLQTSLFTSKIISVIYAIRVKIKVSGLHKSPVVSFPVVIGSLPLYDTPGPSIGYIPVVSEPPPSYEESENRRESVSSAEDPLENYEAILDNDMYKPPIK